MINLINSIIPVVCFVAGLFIGFYMHKEDEIPTPHKIYRKKKIEKRTEEQEDKDFEEMQELQKYMNAIDEYGVKK